MREWRKLYRGIRASDRIRELPFEARWLYILLLSAQDDEGRYPWTPAKIDMLTAATTKWTPKQCESHASRLREQGLIVIADDMVTIVGGAEKNGLPHNVRGKMLLYDKPEPRVARESHASARGEEIRQDGGADARVGTRVPAREASPFEWANILRQIPTYKVTVEQEQHMQERFVAAGFTETEIVSTAMALVSYKNREAYKRHDMTLFKWIERDRKRNSPSVLADVVDWEAEKAKYG